MATGQRGHEMKREAYETIHHRLNVRRALLLSRACRLLEWMSTGYMNPELRRQARFVLRCVDRIDRLHSRIVTKWATNLERKES
jgi:hypothetical protein